VLNEGCNATKADESEDVELLLLLRSSSSSSSLLLLLLPEVAFLDLVK